MAIRYFLLASGKYRLQARAFYETMDNSNLPQKDWIKVPPNYTPDGYSNYEIIGNYFYTSIHKQTAAATCHADCMYSIYVD